MLLDVALDGYLADESITVVEQLGDRPRLVQLESHKK